MKRLALALLAVVLAVVCVLVIRTASFTSRQAPAAAGDPIQLDDSAAVERFAHALRFRTISFGDSGPPRAALLSMRAYIDSAFPRVHASVPREVVNDYALLYTWRGTDTTLPPVVLMAHMDVVPVEPGTEGRWTHPPFDGAVAEGYIWGRGAIDDKVGVLAELEAVEHLLGTGFRPTRTMYLAFGHDEEVAGNGAEAVARLLRSRGVSPALVLDEGGAVTRGLVPGVPGAVALIGIAEKGYVSVALTAEENGGHSSSPPPETTVGIVSKAVALLEREPFPARLGGATEAMLDAVGREMPFPRRIIFANEWFFRPFMLRLLTATPAAAATVRTTTAPTMFEGSVKDNVLPSKARAVVNFRILPGDSVAGVLEHVRRVIADKRVTVSVYSAIGSEPSPVSRMDSPGYAMLARSIRQEYPDAMVAPNLLVGASDARHYRTWSPNVYGFHPAALGAEDLERFHGTNERIGVSDYTRGVRFFVRLIRNATQ